MKKAAFCLDAAIYNSYLNEIQHKYKILNRLHDGHLNWMPDTQPKQNFPRDSIKTNSVLIVPQNVTPNFQMIFLYWCICILKIIYFWKVNYL